MTPPPAELVRLLEQVKGDFDRIRHGHSPITVQLVHKATNAEADGVAGNPSLPLEVVAFSGAGHRDLLRRVDGKGNIKFRDDPVVDAKGNPIVNSAGDAFDVTMPAFRTVTFYGNGADCQELRDISERAGQLAMQLRNAPALSPLAGWRFGSTDDFWWAIVFELAWAHRHPLLTAERRIWLPTSTNTSLPYDLTQLRALAPALAPKMIPDQWLKRLPDAFMSQVNNAAAASFDTVDYLIELLKPPTEAPPSNEQLKPATTETTQPDQLALIANESPKIRRRFAVALTFPGEQRPIIGQVADALANVFDKSRVLYDSFHKAEFSRPNLDTYLQSIYGDQADLVVVFACASYRKDWCGIEWRAIRELMKRDGWTNGERVMFLRFDDTAIDGLLSIDGYCDISKYSERQIADLILQRWCAAR